MVSEKFATVCSSDFALLSVSEGNKIIFETSKIHKRCHVGKELIRVSETFTVILPPDNERFGMGILKGHEAGIVTYWLNEHAGLGIALRVQDRVKYKSPTRLVDPFERQVVSMALTDKIATIFLLWTVCLIGCLIFFVLELLYSWYARTLIVTKNVSKGTSSGRC